MCLHEETIDDWRTGESVCLNCGVVLSKVVSNSRNTTSLPLFPASSSSSSSSSYQLLADVCANNHVSNCVLHTADDWLCEQKRKKAKIGTCENVWCAAALHKAFFIHDCSRTMQEVANMFCTTKSAIWNLKKSIRGEAIVETRASHLLPRMCANFPEIKRTEVIEMERKAEAVQEKLMNCNNPVAIAACILYMELKSSPHMKCTMKEISEISSVSISCIKRVCTKIKNM